MSFNAETELLRFSDSRISLPAPNSSFDSPDFYEFLMKRFIAARCLSCASGNHPQLARVAIDETRGTSKNSTSLPCCTIRVSRNGGRLWQRIVIAHPHLTLGATD